MFNPWEDLVHETWCAYNIDTSLMLSRVHSNLHIILLRLKAKIQSNIIDMEYNALYPVSTWPVVLQDEIMFLVQISPNQKGRKGCRNMDQELHERVSCVMVLITPH